MSLRCAIILILTALNLSNGTPEVGKSLVIVIDVTASMSEVIDLLRTQSVSLLDNIYKWRGNMFENYILVQFGDEVNKRDFSQVFEDTNFMNIKNELNTIKIHGPHTDSRCMASSYSGLHIGLQRAKNDSVILVFTDAGTNNKKLLPEIKKLTQQKQISIYVALLNGCGRTKPLNDYTDLVSIYNGDVFNVHDSKIEEHFQLLAQILTGPPDSPSVEVSVDSTMSEFILTITGQNTIITIFDPDQKYVSSARYKILTNLSSIKMVQVPKPMPGRYTIEIVSETPYSGQVQTKTDLKFEYGFAIHEPTSLLETSYAPFKGHKTYLAISPSNATLIKNLEHVIFATSNNRGYKYKLNRKATKSGELYITEPFLNPPQPFKISVYGQDRLDYHINRLISPDIRAISVNRPKIVADNNITIFEGDPIYLVCRVQSIVDVTIHWTKIGLNKELAFLESRQSDVLNHIIDKSEVSDSGEYICTAENSAGQVKSKSFVTIEHFNLFTPIKSMNIADGTDRVELLCNVSHMNHPTVKVLWLFNDSPKLPQGSQLNLPNLSLFNITRNFTGKYTCVGLKKAKEMRDDIHLKVEYPPKILHLYNFNTNSFINNTDQPIEIGNKVKLEILCIHEGNTTVKWINQFGDIISNTSDLIIDGHNDIQSDEFICHVENSLGKDQRKIKIFKIPEQSGFVITTTERSTLVQSTSVKDDKKTTSVPLNKNTVVEYQQVEDILEASTLSTMEKHTINEESTEIERVTLEPISKPIVLQAYKKTFELIESKSFTMRCPIESGEYNVSWILNGKSIDHMKLSNESIFIDSVYPNMTGEVLCVASNKAGSVDASINFVVLRRPYDIEVNISPDRNFFEKNRYQIDCRAKGNPEIFWMKNGAFFRSESTIIFKYVQPKDQGNYTCVATNPYGNINKTFMLQISAPLQLETSSTILANLPNTNNAGSKNVGKPYDIQVAASKQKSPEIKKIQHKAYNLQVSVPKPFVTPTSITRATYTKKPDLINTSTNLNILRPPYDIHIHKSTNKHLFVNEPYEMKCSAKGNPEPYIYWEKNKFFHIKGKLIAFQKLQLSDRGRYTCFAQNIRGLLNQTHTLFVYSAPIFANALDFIPATNVNNVNQFGASSVLRFIPVHHNFFVVNFEKIIEVNEYESFVLNCTMHGYPAPDIGWYKNNMYRKKWNGSVLTFKNVVVKTSGIYKCVGTNIYGQLKAIFYVNVKKPASIVSVTSPKMIYKRGDKLIIKCRVTGNPLPIIRIYFKYLLAGTDRIFNVTRTPILFQKNKWTYFNGNNIITANQAQSLNRYSVLNYDGSYDGTFYYVIKSLRPEDAGTYTCLANSTTSMEQLKQISISINRYL